MTRDTRSSDVKIELKFHYGWNEFGFTFLGEGSDKSEVVDLWDLTVCKEVWCTLWVWLSYVETDTQYGRLSGADAKRDYRGGDFEV